MNPARANIPIGKYKACAKNFNPTAFDAKALVKLAKDAGMKYIIVTSKHHDGFAMYHSKCDSFNIVISKEHVQQLIDTVRTYQPNALISGRVGYDMCNYMTLGDMEIPSKNMDGLWGTVDVPNDSWGYVWYDQNWKAPKNVLTKLLTTVARGGTYMLNVGLKPDGSLPEQATFSLKNAGEWIQKYPQVVYNADSSPWGKAMPWGDVVSNGNKIIAVR